jgi:hypothetical protein
MRKNGEWIVIDFTCAKSRHVGILHNLTDMRWKPSAGFSLHVDRVPVAYHQIVCIWLETIPGHPIASPIVFVNPTFILSFQGPNASHSDTSVTDPQV